MKDHKIAKLVNDLRDVAIEFRDAQQLRERIVHLVVPPHARGPPTQWDWRASDGSPMLIRHSARGQILFCRNTRLVELQHHSEQLEHRIREHEERERDADKKQQRAKRGQDCDVR